MRHSKMGDDIYRIDIDETVMVLVVKKGRHWVYLVTNDHGCYGSARFPTLKAAVEHACYIARREANLKKN